MPRLTVVAGTVIETQRFINVPMRFGERYLARERREVWLRESDGRESKWIIHTRALPARRGHRVVLLARGQWIVGVFNTSTGADVNYPRVDPPFLLRGFDLLAILALTVGLPIGLGAIGLALLLPIASIYLMLAVCIRVVWRWRLRRKVDKTIAEVQRSSELQGRLRSVSQQRRNSAR